MVQCGGAQGVRCSGGGSASFCLSFGRPKTKYMKFPQGLNSMAWYYVLNGASQGPVAEDEIRALVDELFKANQDYLQGFK